MNSLELELKGELFPNVIQTAVGDRELGWYTYIRVKHPDTGVWYIQRWNWGMLYGPATSVEAAKKSQCADSLEMLQRLINDVYRCILFAEPDEGLVTEDGKQVFFIDESQESEVERMKKIT